MGKDVILRDRLQITLDGNGDKSIVYGRMDLSDYVSITKKRGLELDYMRIQIRAPGVSDLHMTNTGNWTPITEVVVGSALDQRFSGWKVFATTTAYSDGAEVGIASPDVYYLETWTVSGISDGVPPSVGATRNLVHEWFGVPDLHPSGATIVSDLLIGMCVDADTDEDIWDDQVLEVDVLLIAKPTTVTQAKLEGLFIQAQDI